MTPEEIKNKKLKTKEIVLDTVSMDKKPERVALISNDRTWKVFNAGYKLRECLYEYDKMADAVYKFHEDYGYDAYFDLGARNALPVVECLGPSSYILDDEKDALNYVDRAPNYDPVQHLKDLAEKGADVFAYEKLIPFLYGIETKEELAPKLAEMAKEFQIYTKDKGAIGARMRNEYGVPAVSLGYHHSPPELMFCGSIMGIRKFSLVMRRHQAELKEALDQLFERWQQTILKQFDIAEKRAPEDFIFPFIVGNLAHTIMNPKQFEKFYQPYQMWQANELKKRGMCSLINVEGSIKHLIDYYRDLPEGVFLCLLETDKPQDFKAWCPNLAILGGYPTDYLGRMSVEQCVDKAKELLDEVAYDGRWAYSEDKLLSYPNDVKPENLKAVTDYIKEHGVY